MALFRRSRRRRGRHALGAAVNALPPGPSRAAAAPAMRSLAAAAPAAGPLAPAAPVVAAPSPPLRRVELGFRDGSTAALSPESPQAKALRAVADLLAARD